MSKYHLGYDREKARKEHIYDYVFELDENRDQQLVFPEFVYSEYNAPLPEDWPRYFAFYELPDGSKTYVQGDFVEEVVGKDVVKLSREKGSPAYDIPKENVFEYTGVLDINGRPIYEWDYVKIDELGWTGFAFKREKSEDYPWDGINIEGSGGFASDPSRIEVIMNPFLLNNFESDLYDLVKARENILEAEKNFIKTRVAGIDLFSNVVEVQKVE